MFVGYLNFNGELPAVVCLGHNVHDRQLVVGEVSFFDRVGDGHFADALLYWWFENGVEQIDQQILVAGAGEQFLEQEIVFRIQPFVLDFASFAHLVSPSPLLYHFNGSGLKIKARKSLQLC